MFSSIKNFLQDILTNDKVASIYPSLNGPMGSWARNLINDIFSKNLSISLHPLNATNSSFTISNKAIYNAIKPQFIFRPFYDYNPMSFNSTQEGIYNFFFDDTNAVIITNTELILTDFSSYRKYDLHAIGEDQGISPNYLDEIKYIFKGSLINLDTTQILDGWYIIARHQPMLGPSEAYLYFFDEITKKIYISDLSNIQDYSKDSGSINLMTILTSMGYHIETFAPIISGESVTPSYRKKDLSWSYIVLGATDEAAYLLRVRIENDEFVSQAIAYTIHDMNFAEGETNLKTMLQDGNYMISVNSDDSYNLVISKHQISYTKNVYYERGNLDATIKFITVYELNLENSRILPYSRSAANIKKIVKLNSNYYLLYQPSNSFQYFIIKTTDDFKAIDILYPYQINNTFADFLKDQVIINADEIIPTPYDIATDGTNLYAIDNGNYLPPGVAGAGYPAFAIVQIPHVYSTPYIEFSLYFSNNVRISPVAISGSIFGEKYYVKTSNDITWRSINTGEYTIHSNSFDIRIEFDGKYDQTINEVILNIDLD